jgi:hypothetical protein
MEKEAAEEEEESESEEDEDESDSESEDVAHAPMAGRSAGVAVPGLTPNQIKKLLELAAKADSVTSSSSIDKLQKQIQQLMADKSGGTRERGASGASLKEIKALQQKLSELEMKTQAVAYAPQNGAMMTVARSVYTPLTVAEDPAFKTYFKLKNMDMPIDQIKSKMKVDGVSPSLLDTPDAVSPNDPGVSVAWSCGSGRVTHGVLVCASVFDSRRRARTSR